MRTNCREIVPSVDGNLTFSLMKFLECFFQPFIPVEVCVCDACYVYHCMITAGKDYSQGHFADGDQVDRTLVFVCFDMECGWHMLW